MEWNLAAVSEMPDQMVQPIRAALIEVESTFMCQRGDWPHVGWTTEYSDAFLRLREIYEYLEMEMVRQDLTFRIEEEFRKLREHCMWLVRRIGKEVFFRIELAMERELRSQKTAGAYDIYLGLVEVQDQEQEFLGLTDSQLTEYLMDGKLESYRELGSPFLPK